MNPGINLITKINVCSIREKNCISTMWKIPGSTTLLCGFPFREQPGFYKLRLLFSHSQRRGYCYMVKLLLAFCSWSRSMNWDDTGCKGWFSLQWPWLLKAPRLQYSCYKFVAVASLQLLRREKRNVDLGTCDISISKFTFSKSSERL